MNNLFDTPSGPILHQDVWAAVTEEIRSVLFDPVVKAFRSLRRMSANEIALPTQTATGTAGERGARDLAANDERDNERLPCPPPGGGRTYPWVRCIGGKYVIGGDGRLGC